MLLRFKFYFINLSFYNSSFQTELTTCLPLFMERLCNEVTRLSAVKALTMIAASPLRVDLSPILVREKQNNNNK